MNLRYMKRLKICETADNDDSCKMQANVYNKLK